jgi:hypothetical protein
MPQVPVRSLDRRLLRTALFNGRGSQQSPVDQDSRPDQDKNRGRDEMPPEQIRENADRCGTERRDSRRRRRGHQAPRGGRTWSITIRLASQWWSAFQAVLALPLR